MLSLLGDLLAGIELIGQFALWGIETAINGVGAAVVLLFNALLALLPSMPSIGVLSGEWMGWLNWFFPVGDFLTILATCVVMWIAFLAVRYALRFIRAV
jgi:hypothetical protein